MQNTLEVLPCLLMVIDFDHPLPVACCLLQVVEFTDVDQDEDVLFKAGSSEADRGLKKVRTDPRVGADGPGNLGHVGTCGLADLGHGVDAGNLLSLEGIGSQLGQFRRP